MTNNWTLLTGNNGINISTTESSISSEGTITIEPLNETLNVAGKINSHGGFGNVVINTDAILLNSAILDLQSGSILTINDGATLDNSGTVNIGSGAFFNNLGSSNPAVTFHRDLEGEEGWRYITAPTNTSLSALLAPIWTQGVIDGGNSDFGTPNVYRWGDEEGRNREDWIEVTDLTQNISAGEGFLVFVYADDNFNGSPDPFPKELSVTGQEFPETSVVTNSEDNNGWTLLGNPFGTAIDFANFRAGKAISSSVYVWAPDDTGSTDETEFNSGSWATYNTSGIGDLTNGLIAPFQAFFVENDGSTSVELDFVQTTKSTDITNTRFLFKQSTSNSIRLELTGKGLRNSAWLTFSDDGVADQRSPGDAWQLAPFSAEYALLATEKPGVGLMDIGHFPTESELSIPLATQTTRPGNYRLSVTDMDFNGKPLFLHDMQVGKSVPLSTDMQYEFTISQAAKAPTDPFSMLREDLRMKDAGASRFVITTDQVLETGGPELPLVFNLAQNYPNPFNPSTIISYELPETSDVRLEVFDLTGRQIATLVEGQVQAGSHRVTFDAGNLSSGVYLYRLQAGNQIFTRKLTLIK